MACSQTCAGGCYPLKGKCQIKLATTEIMGFTQFLGHHAVCFQTDNEPTVQSILRCLLNARHALGLRIRITISKIYDHSNALAENAVNRLRGLAGTVMEQLQNRLGVKLGTSNCRMFWHRGISRRCGGGCAVFGLCLGSGPVLACFCFCCFDWRGKIRISDQGMCTSSLAVDVLSV
jgi:hypothetical protein